MTAFSKGMKVMFGRPNGEKTLGEVIKVNPKKVKVKQLEARGGYPIGTPWSVPPSMLTEVTAPSMLTEVTGQVTPKAAPAPVMTPKAATAPATFVPVPGMRVEFTSTKRGKGIIQGTVKSVNKKSVTLVDTSDGHPVGWRVHPDSLRPVVGAAAAPVAPTHTAPKGVRVGAPVTYEGMVWRARSGSEASGHKKGPITGVITAVNMARGEVEVYSSKNLWGANIIAFKDLAVAAKRTESDILDDFSAVYAHLEPEMLHADGERPRAQVARLRAELNRALRALTTEIGRTVNETEAYDHGTKQRDAARAAK